MKEENSNNSQVNKPVFLRSQSASSTVVGAVLLLAIIVSIFSVIRIGYVPEWKNDAEYSHMNDIWGDMTDLKSKMDLITIVLASGTNSSSSNTVTMNVPFHMGGGDVPLIGTIKSSGTLSVANNLGNNMTITAFCDKGKWSSNTTNYGTVTYESQNRYYVDQEFTYEDGALILSQGKRSSMMLYPSIRVSAITANKYNVSIHMVEIDKSTYSPADVISSNTGCFLRLTGKEFKPLYNSDEKLYGNLSNFTLTVNTEHPDAWYLYLNETITNARIKNNTNLTQNGNNVTLTFPANGSSGKYLNRLYVSETRVKVEPGIGI